MSEISKHYQDLLLTLKPEANLIAVSKTKPSVLVREVYNLGQRDFGENKVQELQEKANELKELKDLRWHFIGHLQSNKINQLLNIPQLVSIHSIDGENLLAKLLTKNPTHKIGLFLQVNTSGEDEKGGFTDFDQLKSAALTIKKHPQFYLQGLMTIGKIRTNHFEEDAKSCFSMLVDLKKQLEANLGQTLELSMGMSSDYLIAQEMGANWLRIGSQIFGKRD